MALIRITPLPDTGNAKINGIDPPLAVAFHLSDDRVQPMMNFLTRLATNADILIPALTAIVGCITCGAPPPKAA